MEALSTKIAAAKEKLGGDGGDVVFETYTMLGDYIDKDSDVALRCGEKVEVMDSENPHGWLVRKTEDKAKVGCVLFGGFLFTMWSVSSAVEHLNESRQLEFETPFLRFSLFGFSVAQWLNA